MERIKLNLIPSGVAPVVHLSQYDEGRKFGIDLFEGDSVYVLDGTETLTVNSRKPDGHVVVISVTNTGTSFLEVETVEQLTTVHGTSYAKLKIEKGSDVIATLEFLIAVSRDPLENGDPSESFVDNLNTQIAQAVSDQYDSNNVIFDNAPTTGHGVGFAVTSEGVKTALDNLPIPTEINDLSDVDTTTPTQGEALVWDGTKWVNGTPELDIGDLDDVTITTPSNGDILVYNNGTWENVANPASTANFAPDYDDTATYNTNDKVIYNNLLYICLEDSVTGAWDSTKWQQISTADYNASNLPISANDTTDTKNYIDTGLSGRYTKSEIDNLLNGRPKLAYWSSQAASSYSIPLADLRSASGRDYGMAVVFAWKEIFAFHYDASANLPVYNLTQGGNRTLTVAYNSSTQSIDLTFSGGNIWYGIGVIAI